MLDPLKYCRSCHTSNPEPEKSLTQVWMDKSLCKIFEECTGINIIDDTFSKILCESCYKKLLDSYNFRSLSQETHIKLINDLKKVEIKEEENATSDIIKEEVIVEPLIVQKDEPGSLSDEMLSDRNDSDSEYSPDSKKIKRTRAKTPKDGYLCIGCKQKFKRKLHLKKHLRETKGDTEHLWSCHDCTSSFKLKKELDGHLMREHKEETCRECQEIVQGSTGLSKHLREIHKTTNCRIDCCPYCAKFVKKLQSHIAVVHNKVKRHFCSICNKGWVTKDLLKNHLKVHSDETPYSCTFPGCNKQFKHKSHVRQHEKNQHGPPSDPVACDVCGKSYKNKYHLKEHRKIHFESSSHKCSECDRVFALEKYLKGHIRYVHGAADSVVCPDCGKTFMNQKKLQFHRRQHLGTDFICTICDKFFVTKRLLLEHINASHDKVRNYLCPVEGCGRAYFRMEILRQHKKKHHPVL